jgi:hypothetical protein
MSAPSKLMISHTGRPTGWRLGFGLASGNPPRALLASIGGDPHGLTTREVERELATRLNAHAATLALPSAAAVAPAGELGQQVDECLDQLTILTVLAKSSDHVYLRDKEPILPLLDRGRRVVLIMPTGWRPT